MIILLLLFPSVLGGASFSQLEPPRRYTIERVADWPTLTSLPTAAVIHSAVAQSSFPSVHLLSKKTLRYCTNVHNLNACTETVHGAADDSTQLIALSDPETVALVSPHNVDIFFKNTKTATIPISVGQIHDVSSIDSGSSATLIIASSKGLTAVDTTARNISWSWSDICPSHTTTPVFSVACELNSTTCMAVAVAAGTDQPGHCLAWFHAHTPTALRHEFSVGLLDGAPVTSSHTSDQFWIATRRSLNQYKQMEDDPTIGVFQRYAGGPANLPSANLTSMDTTLVTKTLVAGTDHGLIILAHNGAFDFLTGPRWLATPNASESAVTFVAVAEAATSALNTKTIVIAGTLHGISVLTIDHAMTLRSKANEFQQRVPQHIRPVTGIVASLNLATFGDASTAFNHQPDDNSGLWTENYMASQVFRYGVTGETAAQQEALRCLSTLETLVNVTGIHGFIARTMVNDHSYIRDPSDHWGWNKSPTHDNWWFIANTSSDEITGHMHGLSIFAEHGVGSVPNDQDRASSLIESILTRILEGGLVVKDITGLTSRWGVWNPHELNKEESWADERGLNSLQLLSYLAVGMKHVTNATARAMYSATAVDVLNATNRYDLNILNQKMTTPSEINFSDNTLSFYPYYMLASSCGWTTSLPSPSAASASSSTGANALETFCRRLQPYFQMSLDRAFRIVRAIKSPLYNIIFTLSASSELLAKHSSAMEDALETLQEYPVDLIEWPHDNRNRLDLHVDVSLTPTIEQSSSALPRHQTAALRWCNNPFAFQGGSGLVMEDPTFFLQSYWMAAYYGLSITY